MKRKTRKKQLEEARERVFGHPHVVSALMDGREVIICEQTGHVFIGEPFRLVGRDDEKEQMETRTFTPPGFTGVCDAFYDEHVPLHTSKSLKALATALEALDTVED